MLTFLEACPGVSSKWARWGRGERAARYNRACYRCILGHDEKEVLEDLASAFGLRPTLKSHAKTDPDLQRLRGNAEFQALVDSEGPSA